METIWSQNAISDYMASVKEGDFIATSKGLFVVDSLKEFAAKHEIAMVLPSAPIVDASDKFEPVAHRDIGGMSNTEFTAQCIELMLATRPKKTMAKLSPNIP